MTNDLESILGELYTIDPSLRDHEAELIPVIKAMMRTRPDVTPDPAFVEHLRMTLRDKAAESPTSFFSFFTMKQFQYTLTGLLVGVIVAAPLTYSLTQSGGLQMPTSESNGAQKLFSYSVEETGSESFGDLSNSNVVGGRGGGGAPDAMSAQPAVAGDSVLPVEPMNRNQSGGGGGEVPIGMPYPIDKMMIAPEMTQYHLKFDGELPALTDTVDIYKRQKNASSSDLSRILGSFNTGVMDLSTFAGAKTDMITFYQDSKYGYMVTVSFREGTISLNQNWETWPHPENTCQDEACFQRYRLKAEEVPEDDVVINVAAKFVQDHSIDLTQYGEPEVDHQWRVQYEAATDKSMIWIPDSVRVVYPLLIDGKPVYEEGVSKAGINIGVNIRENRVSDIWGLTDQKYQKSSYDGVTDPAAIRSFLDTYGKMDTSWMPAGSKVKNVDITLGTPEISLVRMYRYTNNTNEELLVPALVFPVTNVPAGEYFYNTSISIPLAVDLLKERTDMGYPVPMPLMMEDAARAEAGQE